MKSKIYNLVILDESGSMSGITQQTINGCNETINTIRAAQEKFADTQEHFVSIYAFQGNGNRPSRYLIKNQPCATVHHITPEDYSPFGNTPLYDAIGSTIADLKSVTKSQELAIGSVTIITDGDENSSKQYNHEQVVRLIDSVKELGWSVNFIGANIDVKRTAYSLHIDNSMAFQQDDHGTQQMFAQERQSRMNYYTRTSLNIEAAKKSKTGMKGIIAGLKDAASNYFNADEGDDTKA